MLNPFTWFRDRERWGVVIVGLESGAVYDLPFARYPTLARAQGFVDNMSEWNTALTEYRVVDRRENKPEPWSRQGYGAGLHVPERSLFEEADPG